jgi:hypothetical protein
VRKRFRGELGVASDAKRRRLGAQSWHASKQTGANEEAAMTQLTHSQDMEELDFRESHGIGVSLLWNRVSNRLSVVVEDRNAGESFALPVRPYNASDVFHHPYAYAPAQPRLAA